MADSSTTSTKHPTTHREDDDLLPPMFDLPHVVWRLIINYISDSLPTLLEISSWSLDLQDICRPHTSSFFHVIAQPIPPLKAYYYHQLVRLALEGHIDTSTITEFHYRLQWNPEAMFAPSPTARPCFPEQTTERRVKRIDRLYKEALRRSPFIPSSMESEICSRFQKGDRNAALVVLLPLCTRLKVLEPIGRSDLCAALFQRISLEYRRRGISATEARKTANEAAIRDRDVGSLHQRPQVDSTNTLPFSELLVINLEAHQHGYSFPLVTLLPFLGIPSLQRIVLGGIIREYSFPGWPADQVTCSCPEIYLKESSATETLILAFAEGVSAPCEIRQWYHRPRGDVCDSYPEDPTWDRVLVTTGADGKKSVRMHKVFDGGTPPFNHPWVSWLARGFMRDWRRLDEEFSNGDNEEMMFEGWEMVV